MNDSEKVVKDLLLEKYDDVVRPEKGTYEIKNRIEGKFLPEKLSEEMGYLKNVRLDHFIQAGVPDFLAYSYNKESLSDIEITDYLFVEVKTRKDKLSMTQLKWLNRFKHLNSQVVIHDSDKKKVNGFEPPIVNMLSKSDTQ